MTYRVSMHGCEGWSRLRSLARDFLHGHFGPVEAFMMYLLLDDVLLLAA